MNTALIAKEMGRIQSLVKSIGEKLRSMNVIRFGGLLINDTDIEHLPKSMYYPGGSIDLNTYVKPGIWDFESNYWHAPGAYGGSIQVIHSQGVIIQTATSRTSIHMAKRVSADGGNTWGEWDNYVSFGSLPARKYQSGTLSAGENIIALTEFTIDAANPDSHMLFVDGVYMMESKPCTPQGDPVVTGIVSHILISDDVFAEDLPYKVYNSVSVMY